MDQNAELGRLALSVGDHGADHGQHARQVIGHGVRNQEEQSEASNVRHLLVLYTVKKNRGRKLNVSSYQMGYSNVAGDLNVAGTSTLSTLVVNGSTQHYGPVSSTSNAYFSNLVANTLTVTGNFIVTATNTSVSNALSIVNQGSATALYVNQNESAIHTHNVVEFYDHTTIAMIIDPHGNVAIHQTSSPGYALSVVDGVSMDVLTLGTPLSISSGGTGTATGAPPNQVFAGPSIGSAGAPSFRALVNADLPSIISVSNVSANGSGLSSLNSSNLVGNVANANVALVVSQASQPNITSVGTLTGLAIQGLLVASNGSAISNVNGSNVSTVPTSLSVITASQPNITSVGTLTGLNIQGLLIVSNGSGISNINSSNLVGNVANANVALVVSQASQPNITSVGTLTGLTVSGLLIASNGSGISNVNGSNVSTVPTSLSVITASQPNITSVGTLTGLNVQGLLIASNGSAISNLNSSNLIGNVASANVALVVSQPSQPNITSVGTLTGLAIQGLLIASNGSAISNVNGSNVSTVPTSLSVTLAAQPNITSVGTLTGLVVSGVVNSNLYTGNASGLSNIAGSNVVGPIPGGALVVTQAAQPNITSVGTLTGLVVSGILNSNLYTGNASGLSNITGSNVSTVPTAQSVIAASQGNITSVGTLTGLNVQGLLIASNGSGISNVNGSNVSTVPTSLSVITASQPNITSVGTLTGLNVQGLLIASNGSAISNVNGSNVSTVPTSLSVITASQPNITSVGTLTGLVVGGILNSNLYTGNASGLSNITGSNVSTVGTAQSVTVAAQPNITSVGTLTGLIISGVMNSSLYTGNASGLSNVSGSNVVGPVPGGALVVTQAAQPNITSVGTLTGLVVGGVLNSNLYTGNASGLSNITGSNVVGPIPGGSLVVTQAAQPNITSVGTLTGLTVAGILSASLHVGNASGLSNITGSNVVGPIPGGSLVVTQAAQPNITSVGTLTGLNVQGLLVASNGSGISNLNSSNLIGNVANANVALVVSQPAQPNITSVGTLTGLTATTANVGTLNVVSISNLVSLTTNLVSTVSNIVTANIGTVQTTNLIPATTGLFMNLNASYTLNSTGNWYGNVAGTLTSNLFTLFAPNPVANWTKVGSNPFISGPNVSGSFQFLQPGPYVFTCVLSADNDIKTIALSSNAADVHSNLANPGVWLYCYRVSVGMNPSYPITIPVNVTNTSLYYWIDIETVNQSDNIHKTAYTNVTSEAYTGSYVLVRPL